MLAEVREADATGEVAEAFARIRAVLGVPVVNFIWRHLATIDGALAWALPIVEKAAPTIGAAVPQVVAEADRALAAAGVSRIDLRFAVPDGVAQVVATYNRGNSWNMLATTLLAAARLHGASPEPGTAGQPAATATRDSLAPVPPFPVYGRLDRRPRRAIDELASAGPAAASGVRPSLWVHLALWPEVLVRLEEACVPVLGSPAFAAAYEDLFARGAAMLGVEAPAPALRAAPDEQEIDRALRIFRLRIAEMVLIGRVVDGALPHPASR